MISVNDLKTGLTLELDNGLWAVIEFLHVKPGKGAAFVKTKLKKIETHPLIKYVLFHPNKIPINKLNTPTIKPNIASCVIFSDSSFVMFISNYPLILIV